MASSAASGTPDRIPQLWYTALRRHGLIRGAAHFAKTAFCAPLWAHTRLQADAQSALACSRSMSSSIVFSHAYLSEDLRTHSDLESEGLGGKQASRLEASPDNMLA